MRNPARSAESTRKAYEMRDRVSERERFYLASHYEIFSTGNLEAARKTLESWAHAYPRDSDPSPNLLMVYEILGDYDKALPAAKEALRLAPDSPATYSDLVSVYIYLDRLEDAKATAKEALAHNLDSTGLHIYSYEIDFLQHDPEGMRREAAAIRAQASHGNVMLELESLSAAYAGKFARARDFTQQAAETAKRAGDSTEAAAYLVEEALSEALAGNREFARRQAHAALALANDKDTERAAGTALALVGDASEAARLARDLTKRFPENTQIEIETTTMEAGILLSRGEAGKAVELMAKIAPYEFAGDPASVVAFVRGEALLAAHEGATAAVQFQKILDHPGIPRNFVPAALANLGLGRAYVLMGETGKARDAYQRFLGIWKDADPNLAVLGQAKAEVAKLNPK